MYAFLPGQHCVLQFSLKELDPGQLFPPQEGVGLLQLLDRDLVPVPHDLLQEVQLFHNPQLPSTLKEIFQAIRFVKHIQTAFFIPGQQRVLQFSVEVLDPGQFRPP